MLVRGDSLEGAILATIAYFDVFAFAPRAKEIHRYLIGHRASRIEIESALAMSPKLVGILDSHEGSYFLSGKEHLALRRIRFKKHAANLWPKARHIANVIESTGLATCGLVTGSLAADNADEHADVDFLLTYPPERTWTSFGLVRALRRVPWLGLASLCPNYALSEDALEVRPQNLFTAHEIAKAVPMFGFEVYRRFVRANAWVRRFLPNALPLLDDEDAGVIERDPWLVRTAMKAPPLRWVETFERKRKFGLDKKIVGVDMEARKEAGSMDRHSPSRSSYALSELTYRMRVLGLESHPLYEEICRSCRTLARDMTRWGTDAIVVRPEA